MRFSRSANAVALVCLYGSMQAAALLSANQSNARASVSAPHRCNELTLAGLRPGRDTSRKVRRLFPTRPTIESDGTTKTWKDSCGREVVSIDVNDDGTILAVRVAENSRNLRKCTQSLARRWVTGHGVGVGDPCSRVLARYAQPDSRSPSTGDPQKLELLYYAFDWAGPDVPQVMEVFCTLDPDGKLGKVAEITLAAPGL